MGTIRSAGSRAGTTLETRRLLLLALDATQLELCLAGPQRLEEGLGFPLSPSLLDDTFRRAIRIKLDKMTRLTAGQRVWATYWLVVVKSEPRGIGLAGFKGPPDEEGAVEIGYGVDPDWRRRGFATEALRALLDWAFAHEGCHIVTAHNVRRDNLASRRVLDHIGMQPTDEGEETLDLAVRSDEAGR